MQAVASEEPVLGDAFGAALRKCYDAGHSAGAAFEIIERSDGLIEVGDAAGYFAGYEEWPSYEQDMLSKVYGRVLDVGCGAGRHAAVLADSGYEVVGIDPSPGAVDVARARGVHALLGTAAGLPRRIGAFSTILLLGHNLGLLGGPRQSEAVLNELARVAEPRAQILASGRAPHITTNPDHLRYHDQNRARDRMPGQTNLRIRHGRLATPYFDYLFCSETELSELAAASPWQVAEVQHTDCGDYTVVLQLRATWSLQ